MINRKEELAKVLVEKAWKPVGELERHLAILLSQLPNIHMLVKEQLEKEKRKLEEEALRLLEGGATSEAVETWLKGAAAKIAVGKSETIASVLEEPARQRLLSLLKEVGLAPIPLQRAYTPTAPARVELPPGVRAPAPLYSPSIEPGAPWWRQPLIVEPRALEQEPNPYAREYPVILRKEKDRIELHNHTALGISVAAREAGVALPIKNEWAEQELAEALRKLATVAEEKGKTAVKEYAMKIAQAAEIPL